MDALDAQLRSPDQPLVTQNYRFLGFINDVGEAMHSFLPKPIYVRLPAAPCFRLPPPPFTLPLAARRLALT